MGQAAGAISGVSSIASVGAGLLGGSMQQDAAGLRAEGDQAKAAGENASDQAQADRLDRAAQYGKAQAVETDTQLRENLNVTLGNIDAVRAAQNTDPTSPTTAALSDRTAYIADRARSIQVGNINAQAAQNESDAAYLRQAGAYAVQVGGITSAADIAGGNAAMLGSIAGAAGTVAKTDWSKFGFGKS